MDGIELEFNKEALKLVAQMAIERKTGARGLRAILEEVMLEIMYELPSRKDVVKCSIDEKTISQKAPPKLIKRPTGGKKQKVSMTKSNIEEESSVS
jgi:ATP-dependent Clp protease ATP-binding subunit ClpX